MRKRGAWNQNSECDAMETIKPEKCSHSMPLHQSSRLGRCVSNWAQERTISVSETRAERIVLKMEGQNEVSMLHFS